MTVVRSVDPLIPRTDPSRRDSAAGGWQQAVIRDNAKQSFAEVRSQGDLGNELKCRSSAEAAFLRSLETERMGNAVDECGHALAFQAMRA